METQTNFPLFTVIIPVKNRGEYIENTLKTCMIQDYPNFEIIVSDDGSTDDTKEIVERLTKIDNRIKIYSHTPSLGMRDNFEFALNQVRPGYLIALGGDDGLLPGSIQKMYDILTETKTELLTWSTTKFIFPGLYSDSGRLILSKRKGVKIIKSNDFLKKMSINLNYNQDDECPMFYIKGVVSTRLIQKVKERSFENRFYSCPTPDGYSGIVLAGEVEKYSFTGEPLSILGSTNSSQGVSYFRNDKKSLEESNSFFKQNELKPMHEELASQQYSPLIALMTADYLLTSRDLPGWAGEFPPIDFKNLLKKCFDELSDAFYSTERMNRELQILKEIAIKHEISEYYYYLLKNTRKKKYHTRNMQGSGFSLRSYFFDSKTLKINNILDAAYASMFLYSLTNSISFRNINKIIFKTLYHAFKMRSLGERISSINDINKNNI